MLLLPDHLPFPTLELENQKEPQDINIQNYIQHEDDISHLIEADTACEPSNTNLMKVDQKEHIYSLLILRTM